MSSTGKITLDWGFIFDYYSILLVKITRGILPTSFICTIEKEILNQIGEDLFNKIVRSDEFNQLYNSNLKVYDFVEKARKRKWGLAYKVDNENLNRWKIKNSLQVKFFGSQITEVKSSL